MLLVNLCLYEVYKCLYDIYLGQQLWYQTRWPPHWGRWPSTLGKRYVLFGCVRFNIWLKVLHSSGDVTNAGEGLQYLGHFKDGLFKQEGILIVSHLLWHGTWVFWLRPIVPFGHLDVWQARGLVYIQIGLYKGRSRGGGDIIIFQAHVHAFYFFTSRSPWFHWQDESSFGEWLCLWTPTSLDRPYLWIQTDRGGGGKSW